MGAGKWRAEFADYFEGKHVAILPDQDERGLKHGMDVAASLIGRAASLRIIKLVAKDLTEWAEKDGNRAVSSPTQPPCSQPLTGSCDGGDDGDERFLAEPPACAIRSRRGSTLRRRTYSPKRCSAMPI